MKLREIADRIGKYLRQMERDPEINKRYYGRSLYYNANARDSGRYVSITYVSYQGHMSLSKSEAERYLAWLDAGNRGDHYQVPKDWQPKEPSHDAQ